MRNQLLIILAAAVCASCIALQKKPCIDDKTSTISLDPTVVESMTLLRSTKPSQDQLLPWDALDGHSGLAECYEQQLQKQQTKLWRQAKENFGLDHTAFKKKVKAKRYNFTNKKAKRSRSLSHEVIEFVETILQQCGFDPKTVEIIANTQAGTSPAGTISKAMYIYEPAFHTLDRRAFSYIVAHEAMHIRHQDSIERMVLKQMLGNNGRISEKQTKFVNNYARFQETRADIHAILIDQRFAEGGIVYFEHLVKKSHCDTTLHPKSEDRLRLCKTVNDAWNMITVS